MRLLVVRHAVTDWNQAGRLQGRTDIDLNAEAVRQAMALAGRLRPENISRILSSPMRRAVRTALPIAESHGLSLETSEDLQEADMGLWEGLTWDEVRARYADQLAERDRVGPGYKGHKGESILEVMARAGQFLKVLRKESAGKTVLVVTHASPARHLIGHATGDPEHHRLKLGNTSLNVLDLSVTPARVEVLDDLSHLACFC